MSKLGVKKVIWATIGKLTVIWTDFDSRAGWIWGNRAFQKCDDYGVKYGVLAMSFLILEAKNRAIF